MSAPVVSNCEQGTAEWVELRVGKVTASRIGDVLAEIKKGESAKRRDYRAEIIAETLTGLPADDRYVTREMQWGFDQEKFARASYELAQNVSVDPVGFATHPEIARLGGSPDGFIDNDGLVQFKCPKTSTHLDYILAGVVPEEYQPQMLVEMACTGRTWCDFVSFDPRLPEHLQLFVLRFHRDDKRIAEIEAKVGLFFVEIDAILERLHFSPEGPAPAPAPPKTETPAVASDTVAKPRAAKAQVIAMPAARKPTYDDLDPKTGTRKWVNYAAYEAAKDEWLQRDTLRMFQETLDQVVDRRKLQ